MKILFVYPPFCTPTVFPYSITNLHSYISNNLEVESFVLDINAKFHRRRFDGYYANIDAESLDKFNRESMKLYAENNLLVREGKNPELFDEMLSEILKFKPDIVAFSLVYNNQVFYSLQLIKALNSKGIKCLCGGPAVVEKILEISQFLPDKEAVYEYLVGLGVNGISKKEFLLEFSIYDKTDYLSKEVIIPMKTQESCYYRKCSFCTHHKNAEHKLLDLDVVRKTIDLNDARYVYFIDDMFSKERLFEVAKFMKGRKWAVSLRPTHDLIMDYSELHKNGLSAVFWGFESGSQRILKLMRKGTKVEDVSEILKRSHAAGIKNSVYVLFGFPSEAKDEFLETLSFLKNNSENIDLVSTSIFGLQEGSYVCANPSEFGITKIIKGKRDVLDEKITFKPLSYDAKDLRKKYKKTIEAINKLPKVYNVFKEQVLTSSEY